MEDCLHVTAKNYTLRNRGETKSWPSEHGFRVEILTLPHIET